MDSRLRLFGSLALLGTTRRTPSFPESDFPAGTIVRELADQADASPESCARTLLCGSGALFVCGRAGYEPVPCEDGPELPGLCPGEEQPLLPERSAVTDMLGEIFRTGALRLQWEALSHLEKRGMVLAHSLLVPALSMGRGAPLLRPLLARTVGVRGLWLSALNPDWRMFAASSESEGEPDMEAWAHGRPMQRQAFLLAVRTKDPARARELFEKDISAMDASERNTLLGLFEHGLSGDDEDLLERLLRKDRSREVRKTAALLLSLLPESRYLERMEERLAACLKAFAAAPEPSIFSGLRRVVSAVTGKGGVDLVTPPEAYDPSWAEDLISEKSPFGRFGPRAGWLYQMASVVPLSWWTKYTGREPEELLEISERSEWKIPLQTAWGDAELRFGDRNWARAMLKFMKKGGTWPCAAAGGLDRFHLAGLLGREEREKAWEELLSRDSLVDFLEDVRRRQELDYRMSPELADKALLVLKNRLSSAKSRDYALSYVIGELAMLIPSERLEQARVMLADLPDDSPNGEIADRFSAVVLQRRAMDAYFS